MLKGSTGESTDEDAKVAFGREVESWMRGKARAYDFRGSCLVSLY